MAKNRSIIGIYSTREDLERGIELLDERGFRATDVSLLWPQNVGTKDLGHERATKAPEGAAAGAASGAIAGGALGWLAGIGALAVPGIGPLLAAGPVVAALAGAGAAGTAAGVAGALIGYGFPEYEAKRYEGRLRKGSILLSVHADSEDWATRARAVLEETGAQDISTVDESRGDFANAERPGVRG